VIASATTATQGSSISAKGSALDPAENKQMFLKLLVAQLKNQDPTSPMDQKDFMGQMAQFTSVEQLTNMAGALEKLQSYGTFNQGVALIGKNIDYLNAEGTIVKDATVTAVSAVKGSDAKLVLGDGSQIEVTDVVMVK